MAKRGRGGKRPGAGRPARDEHNRKTASYNLRVDLVEGVKAVGADREESASEVVEKAISYYLKKVERDKRNREERKQRS